MHEHHDLRILLDLGCGTGDQGRSKVACMYRVFLAGPQAGGPQAVGYNHDVSNVITETLGQMGTPEDFAQKRKRHRQGRSVSCWGCSCFNDK